MFGQFLSRLTAPEPDPVAGDEAGLALAALMIRIARTDGDYSAEEIARIDRVLMAHHGLSPFEATALRTDAETLEREAPDTVRFTRAIKDAVPHEERIGVIEALWSVALADGVRESEEDAELRLMVRLLGINDRDSALARQRVQKAGKR